MRDGDPVFYAGRSVTAGAAVGDEGDVLAVAGRAVHVKWTTGARAGLVSTEHEMDLEPRRAGVRDDHLVDSLELGSLSVHAAREVYDEQGAAGVLQTMAEQGHLAGLAGLADEALSVVAARVRADPSFRAVTAVLDDDEGEALVRLASAVLLRDALGET
jgi:hypothetical protein